MIVQLLQNYYTLISFTICVQQVKKSTGFSGPAAEPFVSLLSDPFEFYVELTIFDVQYCVTAIVAVAGRTGVQQSDAIVF